MQQDKELLTQLGGHIRKIREKNSTSLNSAVLKAGGVSPATLSRVENGLVDFKITSLFKIASALNVSVGELLECFDFKYNLLE